MKEEKNRQTLIKAIRQLPTYVPNPQIWDEVEQALILQERLKELPSYQPPAFIWDEIEGDLEKNKKAKIISLSHLKKWSAAAAIGLLIISTVIFWNPDPKETTSISIAEETISTIPAGADWEEDEPYFKKILAYYEDHPFNKQLPEYQTLKNELEELEAAKEEIKTILDQYGTNPDIIKQLGKIELERTRVAKKLVSLI